MDSRVRKVSKSSRGCQRCKAKRIKCDERRPTCQACSKAGSKCSGYVPQLRWSRKHEIFAEGTFKGPQSKSFDSKAAEVSQTATENAEPDSLTQRPQTPAVLNVDVSNGVGRVSSGSDESMAFSNESLPLVEGDPADFLNVDFDYLNDVWLGDLPLSDPLMDVSPEQYSAGGVRAYCGDPDASSSISASMQLAVQGANTTTSTAKASHVMDSDDHSKLQMASKQTTRNGRNTLLETFYRLTTPTTTPQFSDAHLVRHYFNAVCPLYSCFDSAFNPFRTIVTKLWCNSRTIYLAIQSMAIAHLANHYRYMAPLGYHKRVACWKSLQLDLQLYRAGRLGLEEVMIGLLLLGLSRSWHTPVKLDARCLLVARNLMQSYFQNVAREKQADESLGLSEDSERFFVDALMYWEMLASFLDPAPMSCFPGYGAPCPNLPSPSESYIPHPWTGVLTEIYFALAEVGRIVRRANWAKSSPHTPHSCAVARSQLEEAEVERLDQAWASQMENFLYEIEVPSEDRIADYDDENTPKSDLVYMANACRIVGLLEMYRTYPRLLRERLDRRREFLCALGLDDVETPSSVSSCVDDLAVLECRIAMRILDLADRVSVRSGACRLQPVVLLSCATYLRLPEHSDDPSGALQEYEETIYGARDAIEARLLALSLRYPRSPMLLLLDVIKEQWQRSVEQRDAHWLDIALEKGWQMIIG